MKLRKRAEMTEEEKTNTNAFGTKTDDFYSQTTPMVHEHPYVLHKELFLENKMNEIISINEDYIEFGYSEPMTLSGSKEF